MDGKRVDFPEIAKVEKGMRCETPSAFCYSSARGMAKLAAIMANGGSLDGKQLMSKEGWDKMHSSPKLAPMNFGPRNNFTQGGVNLYGQEHMNGQPRIPITDWGKVSNFCEEECEMNRSGFYGFIGFGGSVLQWNPTLKIGFAYVPTDFFTMDWYNTKGGQIQREVVAAVQAMQGK